LVEPFEFDEQGPQPLRFIGHFDAERVLHRQAVGQRMRGRRVTADPFGEIGGPGGGTALEEFSRPRCTNHNRALSRNTVSPTTENRKWPGSISPACTGPTGIS